MADKKMNKRGASMTGIVMVMLLAIGMFGFFFSFLTSQFDNYDTVVDEKYNETYTQLLEEQEQLRNQSNQVKDAVNEVREAESGFLVAINGFKGLGAALLLLLGFSDSSFTIFEDIFFSSEIIPSDAQSLLIIGIIAFVIFILISIFKGDAKL